MIGVLYLKEDSKESSTLSLKGLRREDGNHWASTRHLAMLHG